MGTKHKSNFDYYHFVTQSFQNLIKFEMFLSWGLKTSPSSDTGDTPGTPGIHIHEMDNNSKKLLPAPKMFSQI